MKRGKRLPCRCVAAVVVGEHFVVLGWVGHGCDGWRAALLVPSRTLGRKSGQRRGRGRGVV